MPRPSRTRRIFKWTAVGLSLLIVAAWTMSTYVSVSSLPIPFFHFEVIHGGVEIDAAGFDLAGEFHIWPLVDISGSRWQGLGDTGFRAPRFKIARSRFTNRLVFHALIPFWLLLLLIGTPAASLWHRDRRLISCSPDHLFCRGCGYDLTGNLSGVCSECGEKFRTVTGEIAA